MNHASTILIVVTALDDQPTRLPGLEVGADDFLTRPIQPEDLLAAVQGWLRRAEQLAQLKAVRSEAAPALGQRALSLGRLQIDPGEHRVWLDGRPIQLSAREFTLLEYLARHNGKVVPPQELLQVTIS
jgi:two-component system alkaline phosphatase synthesis response regulator PhoP